MRIPSRSVRSLVEMSFWVLIVALAANLTYRTLVSHMRIHAAESNRSYHPIPFTAVLEDVHYDSSDKPTSPSIQKWAVRSDGATVIETSTDQPLKHVNRFAQFPSGEEVREDLIVGTKSTARFEDAFAHSWIRTPSSNCLDSLEGTPMAVGQVAKGAETVDGFDTVKVSLGQITWWFAPKYGCAPIRAAFDGGVSGRNEQHLVTLTSGEPAPTLFDIASSLKEVNPSTADSMQRAIYCKPGVSECRPANPSELNNMDDSYNSHKAH